MFLKCLGLGILRIKYMQSCFCLSSSSWQRFCSKYYLFSSLSNKEMVQHCCWLGDRRPRRCCRQCLPVWNIYFESCPSVIFSRFLDTRTASNDHFMAPFVYNTDTHLALVPLLADTPKQFKKRDIKQFNVTKKAYHMKSLQ